MQEDCKYYIFQSPARALESTLEIGPMLEYLPEMYFSIETTKSESEYHLQMFHFLLFVSSTQIIL